jgi:hypothetical protein
MPNLLFTYYIENLLGDNIQKQWELGGWVIVIRLGIEIWVIGNCSIEKGGRKRGGWVREEVWGLLGFVGVCVFFCCSGGSLCQGLQRAGVVYRWYSRLVSMW